MNTNQVNDGITEVNASNFALEVLTSQQPVLVAFSAAWSRPCQIFEAVLQEAVTACAGRAKVVRVNADDNPDLSLWYSVMNIPTLLYIVGGHVRARIVGTASKEAVLAKLDSILGSGDSSGFDGNHNS